jgi:hypothetical protein
LAQHLARLTVLQISQSNNICALEFVKWISLLQGSITRTPCVWVFLYWKRFALFRNLWRPFEGVCFHGACVLPETKTHGHGQNAFTRVCSPCVFVKLKSIRPLTRTLRRGLILSDFWMLVNINFLIPLSYVYLGPRAQFLCAVLFNVIHRSLFDLGSHASPPKGKIITLRMTLIFGT